MSNFLEKNEVKKTLLKSLSNNKIKPLIKVVCPKCHNINKTSKFKNNIFSYKCQNCFNSQKNKFNNTLFAIDHDLLGVLENSYFKPNLHIIGKDHNLKIKGKETGLELREKYSKALGSNQPTTFITPLILSKNNKKMSKTNHEGIFLTDIKEKYGDDYIQKVVRFTKRVLHNKKCF